MPSTDAIWARSWHWLTHGVIGVSRVLAIEGGTHEGHDGVREWWNGLLGVFADFRIEIVWVRDAGNPTVSELRNQAHGRGQRRTP